MSAFVVSRAHINYLINAATNKVISPYGVYFGDGKLEGQDVERFNEVGQMLWDENIKSVKARYPDCVEKPENMPGPIDETFEYKHIYIYKTFEPAQVLKACDCYEHQSSEHDGWKTSTAKQFIDSLRKNAYQSFPQYKEATWEID